jgi:glycosyltransferase involved in cell wall biosynthesis
VRIALLTEGGYPFARGEAVVWCDRLLHGLDGHEFEIYALSRSARQEAAGWCELPANVVRVHTAPLWDGGADGGTARAADRPVQRRSGRAGAGAGAVRSGAFGRRERRRFGESFGELASAVCGAGPSALPDAWGERSGSELDCEDDQLADRFAAGLYGLAELARDCGGVAGALRSELAVRVLQSACRGPGTLRAAQRAGVSDLLAVAERLERALRPLSVDWYGCPGGDHGGGGCARGHGRDADRETGSACPGLAEADLCHVVGGGAAALPGLLAKRFFGTPLLITEYGVRLREHYLASAADAVAPTAAGAPVRALLASFQRQLAREAYAQAQLVTPGNTHARRWQERCGASREKLRTVYPGMDATPFAEIGERADSAKRGDVRRDSRTEADSSTLVWVGRIAPEKDLIGLLHAFAEVRRAIPGARLRIVATSATRGPESAEYAERCRVLAAQLFPDEADGAGSVGESPVQFDELGSPAAPTRAQAYGAGAVVVLSSTVEGFPVSLVEAMFCGRATVSTDVGAVCEVIGGTGLVVPSRNPRALADSCTALLRDPERGERLGAAARARALELFTVEQNVEAFRGIYLELMSRWPVRKDGVAATPRRAEPQPFGRPAESRLPGRWADGTDTRAAVATSRSVPAGDRPGARRSAAPTAPTARSVRPGAPSAGAARARKRSPAPSWARPDLPDGAAIGPRMRQQSVRTETRKEDRR